MVRNPFVVPHLCGLGVWNLTLLSIRKALVFQHLCGLGVFYRSDTSP
jgi:hypothetical protein